MLALPAASLAGEYGEPTVVELEPVTVEAGQSPWLADRAAIAAFGRLLVDSAADGRSAAWISLDEVQATGAARLEDLFWLVAGAGSPARFGVVTVPNMRGDAADSLFNGQRRGDNLFGLAAGWTAVESVELVRGPPLVRTGPGKRTGGLYNITTRQAVPGARFGSLELRLGTWVPEGGSYLTTEAAADYNVPLGKGRALRLASGWRDDDTCYSANGGRDDFRDVYAAWRTEGGDGSTLDLLAWYLEGERPQSLGVNRPWQGLLSDGLYQTGGVDPLAGQGHPPGFLDPGIADPGLITAGKGDLVPLARDRVLMSAGDTGSGDALVTQARWNRPLGPDLGLEQAVLVERVRRDKFNAFLYAENVRQLTVDSITRLRGRRVNRMGELQLEGGLQLRLEERDNRTNYWNEFAYAYDITTARRFDAAASFPGNIAPGAATDARGRPWYVPSSPYATPETSESRLRQAGIYAEARQELAAGWSVSLGARLDAHAAEAAEPRDLVPLNPLRASLRGNAASASATIGKRFEAVRHYLTAGTFGGVAGNTVGDGINLHAATDPATGGVSGILHREDFSNRSRMVEWGGALERPGGSTIAWSAFHQRRRRQEFLGANDIAVSGAEAEAAWRAGKDTTVLAAVCWLDARYDNAAPAEFGGGSLWNVYAAGAGPQGAGNGLGYVRGFFANSLQPGDYRIPGLSDWTVSLGLRRRLAERWQAQVWGVWEDSQPGNLAREYTIPARLELNASLLYSTGRYELQLVARNLADADGWLHNGDTFFDQLLVSRMQPLRVEGRFRLRF